MSKKELAINNQNLDRRVKLSVEDKELIKAEYEQGGISQRALARKYNVSRRLISFIIFPERAEIAKKQYAERRKDGRYYDKEKHRKAVSNHRKYKKQLQEKGLI